MPLGYNKGMRSTLIIAEAGVNHNGDLAMAKILANKAKEANADVIKYQTFNSSLVTSRFARKAAYQARETGADESQLDMIKKLELKENDFAELSAHCKQLGIEFLSTAFDEPSVDLLMGLGIKRIKIPSGEITNPILLRKMARTNLPVILSSGMSTLGEIEWALSLIVGEWLKSSPSVAFRSEEGAALLRERVTLLHCTTEYPTPAAQSNLRAITSMQTAFGLPVGFSDHSAGISLSVASIALGSVLIEKHFTLDKNLPGPDHKASLEPNELVALVEGVREVEASMQGPWIGRKVAVPVEVPNIDVARRSLVAQGPIRKGEPFTEGNLTTKRPGNGVSAIHYDAYLGRRAERDYEDDELI